MYQMYAVLSHHRANSQALFGGHKRLANELIWQCVCDFVTSPRNLGCWLALCDVLEECGIESSLRELTERYFRSLSPSPSGAR